MTSPIQVKTVTEVVPGVYGIVIVLGISDASENCVSIKIDRSIRGASSEQLRESATTLIELAEYLEGKE